MTLKRKTGIPNWNVLCRWAFVLSIKEPSRPRQVSDPLEGGVEMTWRTFGGDYADIYEALLKARCLSDEHELTPSDLSRQLRQHIYRGIGYLATSNRIANVADLSVLALNKQPTSDVAA
jgi:DNA sulfur modification protein DndE